jgi:hypothetical protein
MGYLPYAIVAAIEKYYPPMSWSINVIGPRAKIIEEVAKAQYLPAGIKSAIIETLQKSNQDGARVATNGYHCDNGIGAHGLRVSLLEVETFQVSENATDRCLGPKPPTTPGCTG